MTTPPPSSETELEREARDLLSLAPPDIPGAPDWFRAAIDWQYGIVREQRLADTRRRAVWDEEKAEIHAVVQEVRQTAEIMSGATENLARHVQKTHEKVEGLVADFAQLRPKLAKLESRDEEHGDDLQKVKERLATLERDLDQVKQDVARLAANHPTLPPESLGVTLPGSTGFSATDSGTLDPEGEG